MNEARKGQEERKEGRKDKREKTFHSLHVPPLVHTGATVALQCGHLQHQLLGGKGSFPKRPGHLGTRGDSAYLTVTFYIRSTTFLFCSGSATSCSVVFICVCVSS